MSKQNIFFVGLAVVVVIVAGIGWRYYRKTAGPNGAAPVTFALDVPFSTQAPNENWDRNEDCEETSIGMANAFLTNNRQDQLPDAAIQQAINDLKTWENGHLGYNANTGAEATTKMAEGAFGLKVRQIQNYTAVDLRQALVAGNPVLLPINARKLGNPKYQDTGPLYHMIVVIGYEGDAFIVNDPGTETGNGNKYTFDVLINAASDWDNVAKQMNPNRKMALVISK